MIPDNLFNRFPFTSAECADLLGLKNPRTLSRRFQETGSYFGVTPLVLWNGRLRWPADVRERLLEAPSRNLHGSSVMPTDPVTDQRESDVTARDAEVSK
jgi:hypothetical protein